MNKSDLTTVMAEAAGIKKTEAQAAWDAATAAIGGALSSGEKVNLGGFGNFSVTHRQARTGRNPQTGATIKIPAKNSVKFKASSALDGKVNK